MHQRGILSYRAKDCTSSPHLQSWRSIVNDQPTPLISILPAINKVLEKILHSRLIEHLNRMDFFFSRQYGFRAFSNTTSCAIDLIDHICEQIDKGHVVTGIFLDLSKAFDMVVHDKLLEKLEQCGVRGVVLKLFESYLSDRYQYVSFKGTHSSRLRVNCGVPQGSCLGPLLFLIYINSISSLMIQCKLYLYADDTAMFYASPSAHLNKIKAESDLMVLNSFLESNGLKLNPKKTKMMHFTSRKGNLADEDDTSISFDGHTIEEVSRFKYLGLILDSHLSWSDHIDHVISSIKPIIGILYKARDLLPRDVRSMIYFSMIHSRLTYMIEIWGSAAKLKLHPVQCLQNRAIRNVYDIPYLTPRLEIYGDPTRRLLPIKGLFESAVASFVYKNLKCLLHSEIKFSTPSHTYFSRHRGLLSRPTCRLQLSQQRMSYTGPLIFGDVPRSCKEASNIRLFKKRSNEYFRSHLSIHLNV